LENDNKNSLWLSAQYSFSLLFSLIGLKLNLLTFGEEYFSIWLLLLSVWGIGSALDLGFNISIVKFVAQYRKDLLKVNKIIATSLLLFIVIGFCITVAGCVTSEFFYINNPKLIPQEAISSSRIVVYILSLTFYIGYLTNVFRAVFEGHNDYITTAKISIISSLFIFSAILIIYFLKLNIVTLAIFTCISGFIQFIIYLFSLSKYYKPIKINLKFANTSTFKEIFKFSISIQITYLIGALIDPVIKYIIGNFSERRIIPVYEIAKRFSSALSGLFSFTFRNALPKTSALATRAEYTNYLLSEATKLAKFGISFSGIFYGVCSIFFAILFKYFYGYNDCIVLFLILTLAESFNNTGYILYVFITGIGKAAFLTILQVSNIIFIITFLISGFKLFNNAYGLTGLYFSVIFGNIVMLLYLKKHSDLKILDFYKRINIWKLISFNFLIIVYIIILIINNNMLIISQIIFSILCVALFFNDMKALLIFLNNLLPIKFR